MKPLRIFARAVATTLFVAALGAEPSASSRAAARAINQLGLDLARSATPPKANACLSPYSIEAALAMTQAGADGATRREMASVLHFGADDSGIHASFAALAAELRSIVEASRAAARAPAARGTAPESIEVNVANRLFGRSGERFEKPFLALLRERYGAPLEALDFAAGPDTARRHINEWVSVETRKRINDLIPPGAVDGGTRLVLANALYLKAPWLSQFQPGSTKPERFLVAGRIPKAVPTMSRKLRMGYEKRANHAVLALPYSDPRLQFVIVLPDAAEGLGAVEKAITAEAMASWATVGQRDVDLHLPRLKLQSASISLAAALQSLGMRTAFNEPPGSADFGRMVAGARRGQFSISDVFHKTFLALDEKGTEAAAATAVIVPSSAPPAKPPPPLLVRVDRPFLFAIQHAGSGACLFLGRVVDPR